MQPDEGYAETVAKSVGYVFDPLRASMDFDKLRKRVLCQGWLPSVNQRNSLLDNMVKELIINGIRGIKRTKQAKTTCTAYENYIKKSNVNAIPYGEY